MSSADPKSLDEHKNCSPGDTVISTDTNGNEYRGTVMRSVGATVYVQENSGDYLEFRRIDGQHISLAVYGKDVIDEDVTEGVNPQGQLTTHEQTTFSMDYEIVEFTTESQELTIG